MTLIYKFIRGHFTPFDDRHSVSKIWARLNQGEKRYATDKDFTYNSDMTLSLDLETWFKVTAHPLPKDTLQVKFKPGWASGREDMPQTSDLGMTDGQKDGRTDHYRAPAE